MKNSNSFQLLELININAIATVKGGTTATRTGAGEWWGGGTL
jgi:hypothetical protein